MDPKQKGKGKTQVTKQQAAKGNYSPSTESPRQGPLTERESRMITSMLMNANIKPTEKDSSELNKLAASIKEVKAMLKDVPQEQWHARLQNLTQEELGMVQNMVQDYMNLLYGNEWGSVTFDQMASSKKPWEMTYERRYEPYGGGKPVDDPHYHASQEVSPMSPFVTRTVSADEFIARRNEEAQMTDEEKRERAALKQRILDPMELHWHKGFDTSKLSEMRPFSSYSKGDHNELVVLDDSFAARCRTRVITKIISSVKVEPSENDSPALKKLHESVRAVKGILQDVPEEKWDAKFQKLTPEESGLVENLQKAYSDFLFSSSFPEIIRVQTGKKPDWEDTPMAREGATSREKTLQELQRVEDRNPLRQLTDAIERSVSTDELAIRREPEDFTPFNPTKRYAYDPKTGTPVQVDEPETPKPQESELNTQVVSMLKRVGEFTVYQQDIIIQAVKARESEIGQNGINLGDVVGQEVERINPKK